MQKHIIDQASEECHSWRAKSLVAALAGAGLATLSTTVLANTYTVTNTNDSGAGSLRQAISDANGNGGTDTINFSLPGGSTIFLNSQLHVTDTVSITGPGASSLTLDGGRNDRIFYLEDTTIISGLTLTHGDSCEGGAIRFYNSGGDLTISNSVITHNYACDGAGVEVQSARNVTITNTRIENNYANYYGGGVDIDAHLYGEVRITNSTISGNHAGGPGGGVNFYGYDHNGHTRDLTIQDSDISNNFAGGNKAEWDGGGLHVKSARNVTITRSRFDNNSSQAYGGGIDFDNSTGNVLVEQSTISNNHSQESGGGINIAYDGHSNPIRVVNSTISGNSTDYTNFQRGGGVFIRDDAVFINTTVYDNYAYDGGGGLYVRNGTTYLYNTIVSGNRSNCCSNDLGVDSTAFAYYSIIGGSATNGNNNVYTSVPDLFSLSSNGGPQVGAPGVTVPLMTHMPKSASPAINNGRNSFASGLTTDERGYVRIAQGTVDIGAVETGSIPYVAPNNQPIPTLSEWGLLSTASLLGLCGAGSLRRRREPVRQK